MYTQGNTHTHTHRYRDREKEEITNSAPFLEDLAFALAGDGVGLGLNLA